MKTKHKIKTGKLGQIGVSKPIGKEWVKAMDAVRKLNAEKSCKKQ